MKRFGGRRARWTGALLALSMMLVSFLANSVQTVQDKQKVAKMTDKMKTVCVGRFLIDLPVEAQVSIQSGFVGGFDLESAVGETEQEFEARLAGLEAQVGAAGHDEKPTRVESARAFAADEARGKVVVYGRQRGEGMEDERVVEVEDVSVAGIVRMEGMSITAHARHRALDVGPRLERTLRRIRPLEPDEIPPEKGFCINRAIVRDPFEHKGNESVVMFAGLPGHPDVNIVLSSMAGTDPAPGLLARHERSMTRQPLIMRLALTHLRELARTINGLTGDELVMRVREPNFTTGYSFQWEMAGRRDDLYAPLLMLELESGANPVAGGSPVQSTLSEEAMFDLWERIAGSIRVRPTETRAPAPAHTQAALGTSTFAGEVCPQSAWWACGDGGGGIGVFGGQHQFVKAGQRMPQALLLPAQTMWQRLRGVQPSFESSLPTLWTLVDKRLTARVAPLPGLARATPAPGQAPGHGCTPAGQLPAGQFEVPIGSLAKTGAACPASGWWRCEDGNALDGTRWFAAGSLLPAATFRAQRHGRTSVHAELIHRRSRWQLVRPVDAGAAGSSGAQRPDPSGADDLA